MGGKFEALSDKPLEQDNMEGVEDHEWVRNVYLKRIIRLLYWNCPLYLLKVTRNIDVLFIANLQFGEEAILRRKIAESCASFHVLKFYLPIVFCAHSKVVKVVTKSSKKSDCVRGRERMGHTELVFNTLQ